MLCFMARYRAYLALVQSEFSDTIRPSAAVPFRWAEGRELDRPRSDNIS